MSKMYVPGPYIAPDARALVRRYPFALLVTSGDGMLATQTPIFFETDAEDEPCLVGHLAARGPHAAALRDGLDALVVFTGPHAYISAGWYREMREAPTWDYVTAQVRGRLEMFESDADKVRVLERTNAVLEAGTTPPWKIEDLPPGLHERYMPLICAFRIRIESIEGATKLNQRHPVGDRLRIIRELVARGDSDSIEVARLMAALPID